MVLAFNGGLLILFPDYPLFSSTDDDTIRPGFGVQRGPRQPLGHGVELVAAVEAPAKLAR